MAALGVSLCLRSRPWAERSGTRCEWGRGATTSAAANREATDDRHRFDHRRIGFERGAGIQADLKTFAAFRVYGASVLTALTAQNTRGVQAIHEVPAAFVTSQMESVFADLQIKAVKIGMLPSTDVIRAVAKSLRKHAQAIPVVLDPVMVAASGDRLINEEAVETLRAELMPLANVVTPNLPEAATLLGEAEAGHENEAVGQARRLLERGARAVLIKGGHGEGRESVDHLLSRDGTLRRFAAPRIETRNNHGTGCTLSAAVAAGLAGGAGLAEAVASAKTYVTEAIRMADTVPVGHGHGPLHHFHALWK